MRLELSAGFVLASNAVMSGRKVTDDYYLNLGADLFRWCCIDEWKFDFIQPWNGVSCGVFFIERMDDKTYLLERMPHFTDDMLHDFIERVSIKEDSGIDIDAARDQAYREMMS